MPKKDKKLQDTTSTTFKADAGTKKYHCGFFCQRKTTTDVIEPAESKKIAEAELKK